LEKVSDFKKVRLRVKKLSRTIKTQEKNKNALHPHRIKESGILEMFAPKKTKTQNVIAVDDD